MATIDDVLAAATDSRQMLDAWLNEHPNEITRELAGALDELARQSIAERQLPRAIHGYYAASRLFDRLGEPKQSLICSEHIGELLFILATTTRHYATSRNTVLRLAPQAEALGMDDHRLALLLLAAYCGYFAFEVAETESEKTQWLLQSLKDLYAAASIIGRAEDIQASMPRYASLTAVIFNRTAVRDWGTREAEVASMLCALATQAERWIPVPFVFPKDPEKTQNAGVELARLSTIYGDAELGARRRYCARQV